MSEIKDIVKIWLDQNVDYIDFDFSCGGDSMNETEFHIFNKDKEEIENEELESYFEGQVYNEVDFYECSDGHYMGEFGKVVITLEEDGEGGHLFSYDKQATSEWEETYSAKIEIDLTEDEVKLINEKVDNFNGGEWSDDKNVNYKIDCIITDEEEEILEKLMDKISNESYDYDFEDVDGEPSDDCNWTTNEDGDEIEIKDNKLIVRVSRRFLEHREEYN